MTPTVHHIRQQRWFVGTLLAAVALSATTLGAQSTASRITTERIRTTLEKLPNYGVFDSLGFEVEEGSVTLVGYAYNSSLKSDAAAAVRQVPGVDEIGNRIEMLPASRNDDRIRWLTFYNIYTDTFLSRYAPGGPDTARYEALRFSRFPGLQPYGHYAIHIVVKRGHTTLVGVVNNESDKTVAGMRAREVPGVFSVANELVVESN
jgi:hyperosmotically inducible periplasmic protein